MPFFFVLRLIIAYSSANRSNTQGAPIGTNWCSPGKGSSPVVGGPGALLGLEAIFAIAGASCASGEAMGVDEAKARKLVIGITAVEV